MGEVSGGQALTQQLYAMHLGFNAASAVVAAPSSPDGPPEALRCPQYLVASDSPGGAGFSGLGVSPRWDDRVGAPGCDRIVALAGV